MSEQIQLQQRLLKENEAADFLAVEVSTLRRWRWAGKGPQFLKIGGAVRYELTVLEALIETSRRRSTSDPGTADPIGDTA